jgi:cobalamin biosynthesis Mg chelatase CobN
LIEAVHDAYLGDEDVRAFILRENPAAAKFIAERFLPARRRGLWHPVAQFHRRRSRLFDCRGIGALGVAA